MSSASRGPQRPPLRLVRPDLPHEPEPGAAIGVLSMMTSGGRPQWLRVGVAHVEEGLHGDRILCVELGAVPVDRRMYIPLGEVLACCSAPQAGEEPVGV